MPKHYLSSDVLTEAKKRIALCFDDFERIFVSFSGGKDSSVMLHLALKEAKRRDRIVDVLFIDLEAQYRMTINHIEEMACDPNVRMWWICLPLNLRNAVSVFHPHWIAWDPSCKDLWVRQLPDKAISDPSELPFWRHRMEFEEFILAFPKWICQTQGVKSFGSLVGIRTDESLNRYKAVAQLITGPKKSVYKRECGDAVRWGTVMTDKDFKIVSLYPIYDWGFEDIWTYIGQNRLPYNKLYDRMHLAGIPTKDMRICQPYGDDQRKGLDLWAQVEPETWALVLNRVAGVNYGARYCGDKFLGYNRGLGLPPGHTWQSYTLFLLSTVPDLLREQYLSKFAIFLEWWFRHGCPSIDSLQDDESDALKDSDRHRLPSWRRLALCILKNDFNGKSLSIGMVKDVVADVYDRISAGESVKVRKSVQPVYDQLRAMYFEFEKTQTISFPEFPEMPKTTLRQKWGNL